MNKNNVTTKAVWVDPGDAPELTGEWFEKANLMIGDIVIRRGCPPGSAEQAMSLRLDADIFDASAPIAPDGNCV